MMMMMMIIIIIITTKTQHGPSQSPPNIGDRQENGKKLNKWSRWSQEEMEGNVMVFHIH